MEDDKDVDLPHLMGQVAGSIGAILPAKQIVDEMVEDAAAMLRVGQSYIAASSKL